MNFTAKHRMASRMRKGRLGDLPARVVREYHRRRPEEPAQEPDRKVDYSGYVWRMSHPRNPWRREREPRKRNLGYAIAFSLVLWCVVRASARRR